MLVQVSVLGGFSETWTASNNLPSARVVLIFDIYKKNNDYYCYRKVY